MAIGHLQIRDSVGCLFSLFQGNITISSAEIVNVTFQGMLMYLSNSRAEINSGLIPNMTLTDVGSLATLEEQSTLQLHSVTLRDLTSTVHGVLSLQQSSLILNSCTVTRLNMSLITAESASVYISHSILSEIWISFEGKFLSTVPIGGVLSCTKCQIVYMLDSQCSGISTNEGGVILAHSVAQVVLEGSRFTHVSAKTNGGVLKTTDSPVIIRDCTFDSNTANIGGVVHFQSEVQSLRVTNSLFTNNSALEGSCIRWVGKEPQLSESTFANNSALYGNPLASVPNHFMILHADTLQPVSDFPVTGVTGQLMEQPLVVGVFDVLDQLIVTENSTVVSLSVPPELHVSGTREVLTQQGLASFSLLFTTYSNSTFNFTFYSLQSSITNLTFNYRFRDCVAGEIRTESGCFPCPKNSYSFNPADSSCSLCPIHAECYGRTVIYLDTDFWRPNNLTDDIYPCLIHGACEGGLNSDCSEAYRATLCGACSEGFYQYGLWTCRDCGDEISKAGRVVIVLAFLVSVVTVPPQLFLRTEGWLYKLALLYRVLSNYSQSFLFVVLLQVNWSYTTLIHHEVWRAWGSLGHVLLYFGCRHDDTSDFFSQVVAAGFFPLAILMVAVLIWLLAQIKLKYSAKELVQVIASVAFIGVYSLVPLLNLVLVSMYQCMQVAGSSWLVADLAQECWTGAHLSVVFKLTIPLFIFMVAVYSFAIHCILHAKPSGIRKHIQTYMRAGYKGKWRNWEVIVLLSKSCLAWLALAYPRLDHFSQIVFFVCIMGILTHAEVLKAPYLSKPLNGLNIVTHVSIVMVVFAAAKGTEVEQTLIAGLGSSAVIIASGVFLKAKLSLRKKNYVPASSRAPQGSQPVSSLGSISLSSMIRPPPSSPAEIDVSDIQLEAL